MRLLFLGHCRYVEYYPIPIGVSSSMWCVETQLVLETYIFAKTVSWVLYLDFSTFCQVFEVFHGN